MYVIQKLYVIALGIVFGVYRSEIDFNETGNTCQPV